MLKSDTPQELAAKDAAFLKNLQHVVQSHAHDPQFNIPTLAKTLRLSENILRDRTQRITGLLPGVYLRIARLQLAAKLLSQSDELLKNVARNSGFLSYQGFWRSFTRWQRTSPSSYRLRHRQMLRTEAVTWTMPPPEQIKRKLMKAMKSQPWLKQFLRVLTRLIEEESVDLDLISNQLNLGPSQLTKKLKKALSVSPMRLLADLRILHAAHLLSDRSLSISEVAYASGFFDQPHFTKSFRKKFNCSPSTFRQDKSESDFYHWLKNYLDK